MEGEGSSGLPIGVWLPLGILVGRIYRVCYCEGVNHRVWTLLSWYSLPLKCLPRGVRCPTPVLPTTKMHVCSRSVQQRAVRHPLPYTEMWCELAEPLVRLDGTSLGVGEEQGQHEGSEFFGWLVSWNAWALGGMATADWEGMGRDFP